MFRCSSLTVVGSVVDVVFVVTVVVVVEVVFVVTVVGSVVVVVAVAPPPTITFAGSNSTDCFALSIT